jgi:hypothetical protein
MKKSDMSRMMESLVFFLSIDTSLHLLKLIAKIKEVSDEHEHRDKRRKTNHRSRAIVHIVSFLAETGGTTFFLSRPVSREKISCHIEIDHHFLLKHCFPP